MNIQPLDDRVVIKPLEEEIKPGRIIIPDDAKEKSMEGLILAVGPGQYTLDGTIIPMCLKEGDRVLYSKFVGVEVTYRGIDYLVMKESEVLAVLGQEDDEKE